MSLTKDLTAPLFKHDFAKTKSDLAFILLEHDLVDWKAARAGGGAGEQLEGAGGGGQQQEEGAGGAAHLNLIKLN